MRNRFHESSSVRNKKPSEAITKSVTKQIETECNKYSSKILNDLNHDIYSIYETIYERTNLLSESIDANEKSIKKLKRVIFILALFIAGMIIAGITHLSLA